MAPSIAWNLVNRDDVVRAIAEYDRLGQTAPAAAKRAEADALAAHLDQE